MLIIKFVCMQLTENTMERAMVSQLESAFKS